MSAPIPAHPEQSERPSRVSTPVDLTRYAWLSIAAAVFTITVKTIAWRITGSVGLLSDAAESIVNLVAAGVALWALRLSIKPADKNHNYGHSKAEYFSAAVEGVMIFVAAAVIMVSAVDRFMHPQPLENVGIGLLISCLGSLANGVVSWILLRAGKKHRSMTLVADGKHLLADVYTSVGIVVGVFLVWLSGWHRLDSVVAFVVGVNILVTGWHLIADSTAGLMDVSLPREDNDAIREVIARFTSENQRFHALRTRESGHRRFMEVHMLVPGAMSVQESHDRVEDLTTALVEVYPDLRVLVHVEPLEDPRSYEDIEI